MGRLDGKVAVVTGAARGSGEAIARRFVAEGAEVVLTDVRDELGAAVAADLGDAATFVAADVASEDDWARVVAQVSERHGRLDVLVNNAAVLLLRRLVDTTPEDFERLHRVNELGPFLGMRAAVPPMAAGGGGSIITVSSIDGLFVAGMTSAYAATKFGVRGLTKVAALELGAQGIRVNCICPAAGNPQMIAETLPQELRAALGDGAERLADAVPPPPVGRHGRPDDVAAAAVFLASDESSYITGADLVLDGGESVGMRVGR